MMSVPVLEWLPRAAAEYVYYPDTGEFRFYDLAWLVVAVFIIQGSVFLYTRKKKPKTPS